MKRSPWAALFARQATTTARAALRAGSKATAQAVKAIQARRKPPAGGGDWLMGVAMTASGARRYRLFRPAGVKFGERLPLMVMLHGCHQDARSFAASTRMNTVAARERFLVLYPEQDRLSNAQGCWNWFDTQSGRAFSEAASIIATIDQVCLLYAADRERVAVAGLSAGASMAALLATRHAGRFKAVAMHSGIPPGTANSTLSAVGAMQGRGRTRQPIAAAVAWPPLMVIHGGADGIVSDHNAEAAVQLWSQAAGARSLAHRSLQRGKRYPMTVTDFKRGRALVATRVQIGRLGHGWSGGAAGQQFSDAQGPDASRMIWRFAAKQFEA